MANNNRLYKVTTAVGTHLVEAPTATRAVAFIARKQIDVSIPTQMEVFALSKAGVEIESVNEVAEEAKQDVAEVPAEQ